MPILAEKKSSFQVKLILIVAFGAQKTRSPTLKSVTCYADKPETIDALKDNIREAIGEFFFIDIK